MVAWGDTDPPKQKRIGVEVNIAIVSISDNTTMESYCGTVY